ncbi:hypothetical protein [Arcicella rosea]|uniref:Lipopolysaccharide export LptBFGC system permease protein LptF n=1 Tax=Arcicella rosea TaxID=502909 RepID=A0A841EJW9_9BACT|nr:hypothetical protein [Arcicella rosea]MBB6003236.1 lipopolysaccharide export LptBFGC system permease protein LptF [Arcicella rosea]
MTHLKFTVLSFLLIFLIFSCKDDKATVTLKTKTENLTSTVWQVQSASASGGLVVVYSRDQASNGYDLSKVRLSFKTNGTVTAIDNNGNTSSNGTWKFTNNEATIEITGINVAGLSAGSLTVVQLTDKNFDFNSKASFPQLGISDVDATVKMTPAP